MALSAIDFLARVEAAAGSPDGGGTLDRLRVDDRGARLLAAASARRTWSRSASCRRSSDPSLRQRAKCQ